jgi:hypothetical protein
MEAWKHVCMIVKHGIMEMSLMNMICEKDQKRNQTNTNTIVTTSKDQQSYMKKHRQGKVGERMAGQWKSDQQTAEGDLVMDGLTDPLVFSSSPPPPCAPLKSRPMALSPDDDEP